MVCSWRGRSARPRRHERRFVLHPSRQLERLTQSERALAQRAEVECAAGIVERARLVRIDDGDGERSRSRVRNDASPVAVHRPAPRFDRNDRDAVRTQRRARAQLGQRLRFHNSTRIARHPGRENAKRPSAPTALAGTK